MIYIHWIPVLLYVLLVIATVVTVLLDNRQPVKTVTWILVLIFIPVIGILLYIFFGQNTRKMRFISQRSLDQLTRRSMFGFTEQTDLQRSVTSLSYNSSRTRACRSLSRTTRWSSIPTDTLISCRSCGI